ncbi:NTP transferase domain-containing protein [Natrarchaeobius oligotrophus]|uniref:Cobalamin biosynthesis protein CobY n=1 Tax=Natrarchaeobius chitinivorans TaxID=1679083 RepID=A0A3N6NPB8_NATCH|nr:NTP transferase domain-containing protein [Natrarchaeobius chitinivorans]RQH01503.1 cobalamin biosynthesis protein CobY [Natrarchaeobius chitinivorans]
MCGGRGTRLESDREKPLHRIRGTTMVERVVDALEASDVESISAATSPNAPETRRLLADDDRVDLVETPGDGYVDDLLAALDRPDVSTPLLTVPADLPLLEAPTIDRVCADHGDLNASRTVCVPAAFKRRLGVSDETRLQPNDHLVPTGVNVVGDPEESHEMTDVRYDYRLAVNVNRLEDARIAAALLESDGSDARSGGADRCA